MVAAKINCALQGPRSVFCIGGAEQSPKEEGPGGPKGACLLGKILKFRGSEIARKAFNFHEY